MAGAGAIIKKLFGPDSIARQFFVWTVAGQLVSSALAPMFQAITNQAQSTNPNIPASPTELADMVVRGIVGHDFGTAEARKSGTHPNIFELMVQNTGVPPSLIDMLSLWRRGKVDRDSVIRAIKQSRVKNEWIDTILLLGIQPPTPIDILEALLQGQVDRDVAHGLYERLGGDPDYFDLLYNTRGAAPTPNEAAEMARKGIIPWEGSGAGVVSFEQAFLEGPWRNKWLAPWRKTTEYLPPPRTITAMLREGSLTMAEASDLLAKQGVPPALIPSYLAETSAVRTKAAKELTESTIGALYQDHAIADDVAHAFLMKLRYTTEEADFILTTWRMARELRFRNTAIGTVHTQYINHRIDATQAATALDKFGVPSTQRQDLLRLWAEEAKTKVTLLTPAQIKSAAKKEAITIDEAMARLMQHGYSQADATIFLII